MTLESRETENQAPARGTVGSEVPGNNQRGWMSQVLGLLSSRTFVLLIAAVLLILYFQASSDGLFITSTNASLLLRQTAVYALAASAVAILIIMGEIDLSIGSAAYLAGVVTAKCQIAGWDLIPSILAAVGVGLAIGAVQGLVITRLMVPAFIVTLAGFLLWRGLGRLWTDAAAIGPVDPNFSSLTEARMSSIVVNALALLLLATAGWLVYRYLARAKGGDRTPLMQLATPVALSVVVAAVVLWAGHSSIGLPNALLWIAAVGFALFILLNRAKFGRRAVLAGSNHEAAGYAGVNVNRTIMYGFLIMGVTYGLAGVMMTARVSSSTADAGFNLELIAIAAAVIGGNSLRGGIGSIQGAVLGAFLLSTIDNGMALLGVSSYAQDVVKALILVLAVGLDGYFRRRNATG
jgi:ABC-type xylose transport system permease subunit